MHKILNMTFEGDEIDSIIINRFKELTQEYKDGIIDFDFLMNNCPCGVTLTARVTTNYLQLKTIHLQRRNHKLKWWRDFCKQVEAFPLFTQLILNKGDK